MTTPTDKSPGAPGGRTAVVAGAGLLPLEVAEALCARGEVPFVVLVEGETTETAALKGFDHATIALEDVARLVPVLKQAHATRAVLAGGIGRRPDLRRIRPSLPLIAILGRLLSGLVRGDDALLSTLVRHIEASGIRVIGAHDVVPDLLAPAGPLSKRKPTRAETATIAIAFRAAKANGALDIGQAAVAVGRRVVAVEGVEGTDGLLERVASYRGHGRMKGVSGGVLVKCAKPGQEERADLPTIGPLTVDAAHRAGLSGIAVEAGKALILQQRQLIAAADALGLFVVGVSEADLP